MIFSFLGIVCSTVGTIFTLWTIFTTKADTVGTWGELKNRKENFIKEKNWVITGLCMIVIGAILQIIGLF